MVVSIQPRHPVDTGYSWMVCLGGFLLNFFVNGSLRSMGILFVEITELYQAKASISAAIMSFNMCGYAIFAAVGNAVGAMSTMRLPCLIGSVLLFIGVFATAAANNIYVVVFFLGAVCGKVKEATGSYADGMYITGVLQILAGIASCLIPTMDRIDRRRPVVHEDLGDDGRGTHELLSQSTAA